MKDIEHKTKLNPKQELFCKLYASDEELFGNGVYSYLKAYDLPPSKYKAASVSAGRLLVNDRILDRINEILDIKLNNETVDKELAFVILQKRDFAAKVAAIREYNRVKKRVEEGSRVLMIGQILQQIEQNNAENKDNNDNKDNKDDNNETENNRQRLSVENVLLDKRQTGEKDIVPDEQNAEKFGEREA